MSLFFHCFLIRLSDMKEPYINSCYDRSTRAAVEERLFLSLVYCGAAVNEILQRRSLPWWVEFSLPQRRNWSLLYHPTFQRLLTKYYSEITLFLYFSRHLFSFATLQQGCNHNFIRLSAICFCPSSGSYQKVNHYYYYYYPLREKRVGRQQI